jgi:hypothetical protein
MSPAGVGEDEQPQRGGPVAGDDNDDAQDDTAQDDTAQDETAQADETEQEDGPSEPVDPSPAMRDGGTLNLGMCHFGGAKEPASVLATRSDGTGWIAVCEEHTKDAEEQGFVLESAKE